MGDERVLRFNGLFMFALLRIAAPYAKVLGHHFDFINFMTAPGTQQVVWQLQKVRRSLER